MTTPLMTLPAAIRAGAKLHPQGYGAYVNRRGTICTCTLGAAYTALTGHLPPEHLAGPGPDEDLDAVQCIIAARTGVDLLAFIPAPPALADNYGACELTLAACITALNDTARWTYAAIATWLEERGL